MDRLRYQRLAIAAVLVTVLLIIELVPRLSGVTSPLQFIGGWVGRGFFITTNVIKNGVAKAVLGADGQEIIEEQQLQIDLLATDKIQLNELQRENTSLKEAVNFVNQTENEVVMARIIGHDPNDPQSRLRINAGSSKGIEVGSAVTTPSGVLIGVLSVVDEQLSTIQLLKRPDLILPIKVPSRPNTFGLLESPDGLSLHMTQVPKESELVQGDIVVTNFGFQRVPPNLPIGIIGDVSENPETLWQQAQVQPYVDTRSLDYVLIIQSK